MTQPTGPTTAAGWIKVAESNFAAGENMLDRIHGAGDLPISVVESLASYAQSRFLAAQAAAAIAAARQATR